MTQDMPIVHLTPLVIGQAHRKIFAAMERLQRRIPNRGMNFKQIGVEAGGYSYTHTRRLVIDLVCTGRVDWTPGVSNSIRIRDKPLMDAGTVIPTPVVENPPPISESDWS